MTWPVEYGGRGLTNAHEAAFRAEAAGHRLPDFGVVGGTTFGICGNTMLQHASPEFLRHHGPRILAGDELWCLLFDEPTSALDTDLGAQVMELIRNEMTSRDTASIVVTHDERIARFADRTLRIVDGSLQT